MDVFEIRPAAGVATRSVIVLLHGYTETGRRMLRKLEPVLPKDALVLSFNGPYPVPVRGKDGEHREGYGWYFYNDVTDEYVRDMSVGVKVVSELVRNLAPAGIPIDLIGFSQGAYLAPFAAAALPLARQVIAVAGRFLDEEIPGVPPFELHCVVGEKDPVVSAAEAKRSFDAMIARGARGSFVSIANSEHRIDDEIRSVIVKTLSQI